MRGRYAFAWTGGACAVLIALVTACGANTAGPVSPSPTVESRPSSPAPSAVELQPFGLVGRHEFVTVAGGQLELWCDGEGPSVMFLSGIGGDHSLIPIGQRLSGDAYACFYDRPGDGPPPPDRPRTAGSDAADLLELLAVAEIPTPVVLVAHSYGGLIAVIAAAEHLWRTSLSKAAQALPSFPPVPVTVITATRGLDPCDEKLPCDKLEAIWLDLQDQFATTLTPDARHVLADTSHYVHDDDPDLVETEILAMLARIEH